MRVLLLPKRIEIQSIKVEHKEKAGKTYKIAYCAAECRAST